MPVATSFDVLVGQAITIGGRLSARQLESRFHRGGAPAPRGPGVVVPGVAGRAQLTEAERLRRRRDRLCMFCASPGHVVRDCPRVGNAGGGQVRPGPGPNPGPNPARARGLAIREVEDEEGQGNDNAQGQ